MGGSNTCGRITESKFKSSRAYGGSFTPSRYAHQCWRLSAITTNYKDGGKWVAMRVVRYEWDGGGFVAWINQLFTKLRYFMHHRIDRKRHAWGPMHIKHIFFSIYCGCSRHQQQLVSFCLGCAPMLNKNGKRKKKKIQQKTVSSAYSISA